MSIKTRSELYGIQKVSEAVGTTLSLMREYAKPGMSTDELDQYGGGLLKKYGARSAPKLMYGFPGYTCISINNEVAHGIPSRKKILKDGDLINIDVSAELNGFFGDNGSSFVLGNDVRKLKKLVDASTNVLYTALKNISHGKRISDVGGIIEDKASSFGFTVIRNLVGHGIGRSLHEEPSEIPCYRDKSNRMVFRRNDVVAVETFISTGSEYAYEKGDGWTYITLDGSFVAQHEHTIMVTDNEPVIFTSSNGI